MSYGLNVEMHKQVLANLTLHAFMFDEKSSSNKINQSTELDDILHVNFFPERKMKCFCPKCLKQKYLLPLQVSIYDVLN